MADTVKPLTREQIDKLRRALIAFTIANGHEGKPLPWRAVAVKLEEAFVATEPDALRIGEERLRRFVNERSVLQHDHLLLVQKFLIDSGVLDARDFS